MNIEPQTLLQNKPYAPAIEHTEPGYLQKRMEEYKQKVQSEEKEASCE